MHKILLIDENLDRLEANHALFSDRGYYVTTASSGVKAIAAISEHAYSCIVLELHLPDLDGYSVCKAALTVSAAPIICLAGVDEPDARLHAMETGAADCLSRPYRQEELAARVELLLHLEGGDDGLYIDRESRKLCTPHRTVTLSAKQLAFYLVLRENPHKVYSQTELLALLWDPPKYDDNVVRVLVKRLRRKLEGIEQYTGRIENDYGKGYYLASAKELVSV